MKKIFILLVFINFLLPAGIFSQYLEVSPNKRFLVKDNGEPFFWLGDTGWEMFHRLDRKEIEHYLRNRTGKGFTVIQCVILSEINGLTVPNREGHLPLQDFDPRKINEKYFELVDFAVNKAAEFGIYLAILPTWGAHAENKPHPLFDAKCVFTPENALEYGRILGQRYMNSPNIVWILGGDRPYTNAPEIWEAMAKGITEGDAGKHLISYHPMGQESSSFWLHKNNWLDFNMVQTGHLNPSYPVYDWISRDYSLKPAKPVINGEPAYEDIGIWFSAANPRHDAYEIRKQAYWSVFAGAFGHTYGNNNIWQMYRKEYEPVISARYPWNEALEQPGSTQLKHLRRLIESRPFLTRIPDQSIILGDNPSWSSDHLQATRDGTQGKNDASYIFVYLPVYRSLEINTSVIPGKQLRIWWYDPRTGHAYPQGLIDNNGTYKFSNWQDLIKENQAGPDWVVVIDDAEAQYATPGVILAK